MLDPLHQFVVQPFIPLHVGGYDLSISNVTVAMMVSVMVAFIFFYSSIRQRAVVPSRLQAMMEILYQFVLRLVKDYLGEHARDYFPFILTLFSFVLFGNLLGLVPYMYTVTSQIVVTFSLAMCVFLAVVLAGLWHHGWRFFKLFFPEGSPVVLAPLLVPIEIISFLSRPVSLALRLFVNMVAGHCILKIFSSFAAEAGLLGVFPLAFDILFIAFEVLVAFIQAYIFAILSCIYLKDALELH